MKVPITTTAYCFGGLGDVKFDNSEICGEIWVTIPMNLLNSVGGGGWFILRTASFFVDREGYLVHQLDVLRMSGSVR